MMITIRVGSSTRYILRKLTDVYRAHLLTLIVIFSESFRARQVVFRIAGIIMPSTIRNKIWKSSHVIDEQCLSGSEVGLHGLKLLNARKGIDFCREFLVAILSDNNRERGRVELQTKF